MKSRLTWLVLLLFSASFVQAQDAPPKAPGNIGVDQFDSFKTNAFDILNQSVKADQDITHLDSEVKTYAGVMASANVEKLRKDYSAVMDLSKVKKNLIDKIGQLDDQGKQVLESAKNFTPKLKSPQAVSNVKKSIDALDFSRKRLTNSGTVLKNDATLIATELKARGEKVEDFVE